MMHRLPAVLVLVLLVAGCSDAHQPTATTTAAAAAAPTHEDYAVVNFFRRMLGIAPTPQVAIPPLPCLRRRKEVIVFVCQRMSGRREYSSSVCSVGKKMNPLSVSDSGHYSSCKRSFCFSLLSIA